MGWHPANGNAELSTNVISYNLTKTIWFSRILLLPAYIIILPHYCESLESQYLTIWATDKVVMHWLWYYQSEFRWHGKSLQKLLMGVVRWFICKSFRYHYHHEYVFWRQCWEWIQGNHFPLDHFLSYSPWLLRYQWWWQRTGNQVLVVPTRHPCLMIPHWSRLNAIWLVDQALGNVPAVG